MSTHNSPERPAVLDTISESQMQELDFQADEYDEPQFLDIARSYGWDEETAQAVWKWFEVQHKYPLDGVKKDS